MLIQISIGAALLLLSMVLSALGFWLIESLLEHLSRRLQNLRRPLRVMLILMIASFWALAQITIGVWIWAVCFMRLEIYDSLEPALYFALISFTTLGYGDVLLPDHWRLLGGMTAVNGLLNVGLVTAIMLELMRRARAQAADD